MLGAIVGDFVGSVHEFLGTKTKDFTLLDPNCTVTDDSLLTVAVAEWLLHGTDLVDRFHDLVAAYPAAGWGLRFGEWARDRERSPYNSFGNGAAMRVSPVGWMFDTLDDTLAAASQSAAVTHNHPEGIRGAQATALAVYLARTSRDKDLIRREVAGRFGYDLNRSTNAVRPTYRFNETCQGTVPEAIIAFLDAADFEDTLRNAISLVATPIRWRVSPAASRTRTMEPSPRISGIARWPRSHWICGQPGRSSGPGEPYLCDVARLRPPSPNSRRGVRR